MQIIRDIPALRHAIQALRAGGPVALVPTMGALHAGHLHLVERAAAKVGADRVIVSIFVNPTQFGPNEDLAAYPRREAEDAAMLESASVGILWAPTTDTVYPPGHATRVIVTEGTDVLCGAARPGHFDGVATVVAKLFNQVQPEFAFFGEKDWQQLAIIRRMTRDLDLPVEIIGVPTVRDADGLALSSRNAYLSADERAAAAAIPRTLNEAAAAILSGKAVGAVLNQSRDALLQAGFQTVDYFDLRHADTLEPLDAPDQRARLFVAARIGRTRLIDNCALQSDISQHG